MKEDEYDKKQQRKGTKVNECRKKGVQQYYGGAENKKEEAGKGGAHGPVELGWAQCKPV